MAKPTIELAGSLQKMFDHLNIHLFDSQLPPAMVVCTRNGKVVGGYHSGEQWENEAGDKVAEIGLNSNVIADGDPVEVIGILIHEMAHLWQHACGTPSRPGYHNKEFAGKCFELGLDIKCLDKGAKEDQVTGQAINTQIAPGGKSELVIAEMAADPELDFSWWTSQSIDIDDQGLPVPVPGKGDEPAPEVPKSGKRTKYHCAICGLNAWAKHGASLVCGECQRVMIPMV